MASMEDLPLFQPLERDEESPKNSEVPQLSLFDDAPVTESASPRTASSSPKAPRSARRSRQTGFWANLPAGESPTHYQRNVSISQEELLSAPWLRHWQGCLWWPTSQTWESLMVATRLLSRWLQQERCAPSQMLVLVRDQGQASALRSQLQTATPQQPLPRILTLRHFALQWLLTPSFFTQCLGCPEQLRLLQKAASSYGRSNSEHDVDELWRSLRFSKQQRHFRDEAWLQSLPPVFASYERLLKKRGVMDIDDLLFEAEERLRYQSGLLEQCQLRFHRLVVWMEGSALTPVESRLLTLLSRSQQECLVVGANEHLKHLRQQGFGQHIAERWSLPFSENIEEDEDIETAITPLEHRALEVQWQQTNNDLDELHRIARWLRKNILSRKKMAATPPLSSPWWPSQVQVIYQNRAQLPLIEGVFRDYGIPYDAAFSPEHLRQKGLWQTLAILRFLASASGDEQALFFLLEHDALIRESTLQQIQAYQRSNELSPRRLIGQFDRIPNIPPNQRILLGYLAEMLIHLRRDMGRRTPEQLLRLVWDQLLNCYFFMDPQLPSLDVQAWMLEQARSSEELKEWLWSLVLDNTLFVPSALHSFGKVALRLHQEAVQQSLSTMVVFVLGCEKDFPLEEWQSLSTRQRREHAIVEAMAPFSEHQLFLCLTRYRMQPTTAYLQVLTEDDAEGDDWEEKTPPAPAIQLKLF